MSTANDIIAYMQSLRDEKQQIALRRFFKTGKGEYGENDEFLGIKVPATRQIVKTVAKDIAMSEIPELLMSEWHEVRLCGFLILVDKFERNAAKRLVSSHEAIAMRDEILITYLKYAHQANNWDLVDLSAPKILGHWLLIPSHIEGKQSLVDQLADSNNLWKQRISMVCTWWTSHKGDPSWCLRYAEKHLSHSHDLMHKAVGWMLREMGKHVSVELLRDFLQQHHNEMSRTTLRYAIEKMDAEERNYWMKL